MHGLRTPNEGINQRYLKNWADVTDKIFFGRTEWEWIFGRAVKAISSLDVRSPCHQPIIDWHKCTTAGKAHKACALPRFWVSIPVKKIVVEYCTLPSSNSPWRPCDMQIQMWFVKNMKKHGALARQKKTKWSRLMIANVWNSAPRLFQFNYIESCGSWLLEADITSLNLSLIKWDI